MEADVIIINENGIFNGQLRCNQIKCPEIVSGRWIRVAHLYNHAKLMIYCAFEFAGLNNFNVSLFV